MVVSVFEVKINGPNWSNVLIEKWRIGIWNGKVTHSDQVVFRWTNVRDWVSAADCECNTSAANVVRARLSTTVKITTFKKSANYCNYHHHLLLFTQGIRVLRRRRSEKESKAASFHNTHTAVDKRKKSTALHWINIKHSLNERREIKKNVVHLSLCLDLVRTFHLNFGVKCVSNTTAMSW